MSMNIKLFENLSDALRPIAEYELRRGNTVIRVDAPAGSDCPLAIVFALPLDTVAYRRDIGLPEEINTWSNSDSHYDLEAGYICTRSRHVIAGPLREKRDDTS